MPEDTDATSQVAPSSDTTQAGAEAPVVESSTTQGAEGSTTAPESGAKTLAEVVTKVADASLASKGDEKALGTDIVPHGEEAAKDGVKEEPTAQTAAQD